MTKAPLPQIGEIYNPYVQPEARRKVRACPNLSAGAKVTFEAMSDRAGKDGKCFPSAAKVATDTGVSVSQAKHNIRELTEAGILQTHTQNNSKGRQTSNNFKFIWVDLDSVKRSTTRSRKKGKQSKVGGAHVTPLKATNVNSSLHTGGAHVTPSGGAHVTGGRGAHVTPERSKKERSPNERTKKNDIDCQFVNHKNRDSRPDDVRLAPSKPKEYPRLRRFLQQYMQGHGDDSYPTDVKVVEIMDASAGESENAVCECLKYLYTEKGLKPGTKNGPRSWAWFPVVVREYFSKRRDQEESANPCGYHEWSDRNEEKDSNRANRAKRKDASKHRLPEAEFDKMLEPF